MISGKGIYQIVEATIPLYVPMILAYICLKWLKLFTPEQCAGINMFVAKFSIPLLSFKMIALTNPYKMDMKLIFSDLIQKAIAIVVIGVITKFSSRGTLKWVITGISLTTLPNTLVVGIPVLKAMYGEESASLLVQLVLLQSLIWYSLLLILFELEGIKAAAKAATIVVPTDIVMVDFDSMNVSDHGSQDIEVKSESSEEGPQMGPQMSRSGSGPKKIGKMLILLQLGKKLFMNPNTYATVLGLIWACIKYKLGINMPGIIDNSINIIADGGLGMALFSLGLFMASRPNILACGIKMTAFGMVLRFIAGPIIMLVPCFALGLKGNLFKLAIVQAALPQGIVPFVFAKQYNVHADLLSTSVSIGMLVALPVVLVYYFILAAI